VIRQGKGFGWLQKSDAYVKGTQRKREKTKISASKGSLQYKKMSKYATGRLYTPYEPYQPGRQSSSPPTKRNKEQKFVKSRASKRHRSVEHRETKYGVVARVGDDIPPVKAGSICTSLPSLSCALRSNTDRIDAAVMKIAAVE